MDILHALILGAIQGLTEFLPISSSGHLILVPRFLGWEDQGLAFDTAVHLGTLVAGRVGIPHTHSFIHQNGGRSSREEQKLAQYIVLATIPAGVAGLAFGDVIENTLRSPLIVGASLIFWGVILWWVDRGSSNTPSHAPDNAHVALCGLCTSTCADPWNISFGNYRYCWSCQKHVPEPKQ
ncbi:MAG: undecaprenyl-diphosphate phosphatase [Candidatus Paceibacterota bacterium]|nr:MAG: undecaprenyl-diphosphate phosphatase [Candidatus Paceibacterota bacterium]